MSVVRRLIREWFLTGYCGARWHDLSTRYGNWNSIYRKIVNTDANDSALKNQAIEVVLSGGNIHDSELVLELLGNFNLVDKKILADKAYSLSALTFRE